MCFISVLRDTTHHRGTCQTDPIIFFTRMGRMQHMYACSTNIILKARGGNIFQNWLNSDDLNPQKRWYKSVIKKI